jgi:hypothetical protein
MHFPAIISCSPPQMEDPEQTASVTQVSGCLYKDILAARLSLRGRKIKCCTLALLICDLIQEFALLKGMNTPYLHPQRQLRLARPTLISRSRCQEEQEPIVTIPLSRRESCLLPRHCLKAMQFGCALQVSSHLPHIELAYEENLTVSLTYEAGIQIAQQGGVTSCHP